MRALGARADGATERPTTKLHNQLFLKSGQNLGHQATFHRRFQCADTEKRARVSRTSPLSTTLWITERSGGRYGPTVLEAAVGRIGDRIPACGMNGDRVSERRARGLCRSQVDER